MDAKTQTQRQYSYSQVKKKKQVIQDIKKEVLPDILTIKIKKEEEDAIFQNKIGPKKKKKNRNEKND